MRRMLRPAGAGLYSRDWIIWMLWSHGWSNVMSMVMSMVMPFMVMSVVTSHVTSHVGHVERFLFCVHGCILYFTGVIRVILLVVRSGRQRSDSRQLSTDKPASGGEK